MSVDTKAYLRRGITIGEIAEVLDLKYEDVKIRTTSNSTSFWITFTDGADKRTLWVSFEDYSEETGIKGVYTSLGCQGNSVEIMKYLCETFGGYLDENDCDDKDFYIINQTALESVKEYTKLDELKHKIISKLGYENLSTTLLLFEEYKNQI